MKMLPVSWSYKFFACERCGDLEERCPCCCGFQAGWNWTRMKSGPDWRWPADRGQRRRRRQRRDSLEAAGRKCDRCEPESSGTNIIACHGPTSCSITLGELELCSTRPKHNRRWQHQSWIKDVLFPSWELFWDVKKAAGYYQGLVASSTEDGAPMIIMHSTRHWLARNFSS